MSNKYAYLGTAMAYPPRLENGRAVIVSGPDVIEASFRQIFTTPRNTRTMLGEYGSDMEEGLFELNDTILQGMLRHYIKDAFKWEPRADFEDVEFYEEEDMIECKIYFKILAINEVESFVYPYYKNLKY